MLPTLLGPGSSDKQIRAILNSVLLRREPTLLGHRNDGTNLNIRFKAALAAPWVQFHVQTDQAGEGGASYDDTNYKSTTLVDCRSDLVQDVTTPDIAPGRYFVWLIPVQYDGEGNKILYDGEGTSPDNMVFIDDGGPPLSFIDTYATLYVADGSTAQTGIGTTPVALDEWGAAGPGSGITVSVANGTFTIVKPGLYLFLAQFSFSGTASTEFEMHLWKDTVEQVWGSHRALGGGDSGSKSYFGMVDAAVDEVFQVGVNADGSSKSITLIDAQFIALKWGTV